MNIKELAQINHDMAYASMLITKCDTAIHSCSTREQLESANRYIMLAYENILRKEHYNEYYPSNKIISKIKMNVIKMINKDDRHECFFKYVKTQFATLWAKCSNLYINFNNFENE